MSNPNSSNAVAIDVTRVQDAFLPEVLTAFAQKPGGAHLFRVQHEHLLQLMRDTVAQAEDSSRDESAANARIGLTAIGINSGIHQTLEEALVHSVLASEPRARMVVEQFERELVPLVAELEALARRYPTASSILASRSDFVGAASHLFGRLRDRFRREERDLFPLFERATAGATPVAA